MKLCFHAVKRVVFMHDLIVHMNFEVCTKLKRFVFLSVPRDWRGIYDTSWIDWRNDSLCLKFRHFNFDLGFHGKWNFPSATKNMYCIRFQFDSGFYSSNGTLKMGGKAFVHIVHTTLGSDGDSIEWAEAVPPQSSCRLLWVPQATLAWLLCLVVRWWIVLGSFQPQDPEKLWDRQTCNNVQPLQDFKRSP